MLITLCLVLAAPVPARADAFSQFSHVWKAGDKCSADSIRLNPDRDLASLQKRDAYVDQCLKGLGLPPRAHIAPSDPVSVKPAPPNQ